MDSRVQLQPAYIIHRQPFQNTSLLVDLFCVDYGRVKAVAKGARRNKSRFRALIQLFQPLLVSFSGRGDVKTLTGLEGSVSALNLVGDRLFSGFYINELLVRLMQNHAEHKPLYLSYQSALLALQGDTDLNVVLRKFELSLLQELGYGINLEHDIENRDKIAANKNYAFNPTLGFRTLSGTKLSDTQLSRSNRGVLESEEVAVRDNPNCGSSNVFSGEHIQHLAALHFPDEPSLQAAKRLMRIALAPHLGDKPLTSRSLFSSSKPAR